MASRGPIAANADPNMVVQKALKVFKATRSYRANEVNRKRSGEFNSAASWEYAYPNRMSWGYRPAGVWVPITFVIGDTTFSQDESTKKWKPQTVCSMVSDFFAFGPEGLERHVDEAIKHGHSAKMVGTDTVNGNSVNVYQLTEKQAIEHSPVNLTFWIGKNDNVLYQAQEDLGTVTTTVTYFDLNSEIKIELPA
jgi:hypothetical protein